MSTKISGDFVPSFRSGSGWMLVSLACFTGNALLLKYLGSSAAVSPWHALFFRAAVGLAMVWIIFRPRDAPARDHQIPSLNLRRAAFNRMLISRGVLGAWGTAAYYLTLPVLGAGKATLIGNTWVIWSALMAAFMLKEHLIRRQLFGILIAICGLVLLTGFEHHGTENHVMDEWIALSGAVVAAATVVVIRQLTRTESSATIFASQCIYTGLFALPFVAIRGWQLSLSQSSLLATAAVAAGVGQLSMTEGFRHLPITTGGAFQVALPLCITLGGIALFGETFSLAQAAGAALILIGGYRTIGAR